MSSWKILYMLKQGVSSVLVLLLMGLNFLFFLVTHQLTKSYSEQTKDAFYKTLGGATTKVKTEHPSFRLVVGGDFNATIGKDCSSEQWECAGKNHDSDPTSSNGTRLLNFSKELNLFVMNSFYGYKDIHRWSFYSNLGYKRRLDYFLFEGFIKRLTNCRVFSSVSDDFD